MSITTQFLRRPLTTGAVAASSRRLARAMTQRTGLETARLVVELGPGTGVFTREILRQLPVDGRLVAIELNPVLAAGLFVTHRDERLTVVEGAAAELAEAAGAPVDAVVSGLPWTVMATAERDRTLDAVAGALMPGGCFTTFAYLHAAWTPPGRRLAAALHDRFATVRRTRVVWPNLPPAFVYRATLTTTREDTAGSGSAGPRASRSSRR
ncbi:class I SAM-dependent methyltransferase [Streptomyces sasae]|uniref:class I SAM-dependent methyltransferase n=1 Tax=Streptomyces sasae TaxID=1266772 RepID=UPI00292F02BC|nr:methyltransferase domain-containing protein [Streptomyces sasae]